MKYVLKRKPDVLIADESGKVIINTFQDEKLAERLVTFLNTHDELMTFFSEVAAVTMQSSEDDACALYVHADELETIYGT